MQVGAWDFIFAAAFFLWSLTYLQCDETGVECEAKSKTIGCSRHRLPDSVVLFNPAQRARGYAENMHAPAECVAADVIVWCNKSH